MNLRRSPRGARYLNPAPSPVISREHSPQLRWGGWLALALVLGLGGDVGATESLPAWRDAFPKAEQALQAGVPTDTRALRDYPLYPYLRYQELSRRLAEVPTAEVREFLQGYADSPLADRLRSAWLRQLTQTRRWDDYLQDAAPGGDAERECGRRLALLNTGQSDAALRDFAALWLRGAALPATCDPVIVAWRGQGHPTPEQLWQRFALAMTGNNPALARTLRAALSEADQTLADAWLSMVDQPQLIVDPDRFNLSDPRVAALLSDGLNRWGKRNALEAAAALDTLKTRAPALAAPLAEVERRLALWIASDYHPSALARLAALPDTVVDRDVAEWRVRVSLRQGDWNAARSWLERLPMPERDSPRWQYWRARTLEALGRAEEALLLYRRVAGQRDYHGFLAADRLSAPYAIAHIPLAIAATEQEALLNGSPALRRARELYILGREQDANAEWRLGIEPLDRPALRQAATLAHDWGWHAQAIATISRAEHWDDLELRFPLAYRDGVVNQARAGALDPAWIYAVIRQESGFRPTARSPVGALGLMQIMPATGREIARDLRDAAADDPPLLQPDVNIRYGVHYLRRILERLQNNPVLATAAYNAGPNKVARWLPARAAVPADLWAETIPYRETRAYVQRVMEYTAIYQRRLGSPEPELTLSARMKPVQPEGASDPGSTSSLTHDHSQS